jgi:alginate O-acetyltransferase complex protein AlgI
MLFPSAAFTFFFLPLVLLAFFVVGRNARYGAATWLFLASLYFYAYWKTEFLFLLLPSIVVNFTLGRHISESLAQPGGIRHAKWTLIAGVTLNLAVLAYFKYANFLVDNVNALWGWNVDIGRITLPVGISFFTFTQIAFLADTYRKGTKEYKFAHYGLFVTYFPHLVAGPVLHHAQMMPQFGSESTYRLQTANIAAGMAIFAIGLAKKVILADGISPFADAVFDAADAGVRPSFEEAWIGSLAYTFQIYFDFSGYSDMAIGLSLLFNIQLPLNFNSPYKSRNIIDFWRRWHISLSTFLRDYLYIPLGGGRRGPVRRHLNLMATMLLGGLWHGASWTFVFWGGLHGAYLVANHAWTTLTGRDPASESGTLPGRVLATALTFLCVIVAWVFFRAHSFSGAATMLQAMTSWRPDTTLPDVHPLLWNAGLEARRAWEWSAVLALLAFLAPNSNRIGASLVERCRDRTTLRFLVLGASLVLAAFFVIVNEARDSVSAFIYFNF